MDVTQSCPATLEGRLVQAAEFRDRSTMSLPFRHAMITSLSLSVASGELMECQGQDRLSILVVTTSFPTASEEVSGIFVKRLVDSLFRKARVNVLLPCSARTLESGQFRYPVSCFRYAPRSWQRLALDPGGIPVALERQPLNWLLVPVFLLAMFVAVLRRARRVHVIHANWAMTGLVCGMAGRLLNRPVVTTLRGADVAKLERSFLDRLILKLALILNARMITVSEPMRRALRDLLPGRAHKIDCIPNGVDARLLRLPLPTRNTESLRLVSIGGLIPRKDNSSIIRAMRELPVGVTLTLVGDGVERGDLENLVEDAGLGGRIHFSGPKPPGEIAGILRHHHALVLASRSEGRPNVIVEAMAAGRAVVASRLPGVQELIQHGHNGLLFEPGDIRELVRCVRMLTGSQDLVARLGAQARQTILDKDLSWDDCARQYHELFHEMVAD